MLKFDDTRSDFNLARAERWRSRVGTRFIIRNDLPRYNWILSSQESLGTDNFDVYTHASWLLSQLKADILISELVMQGMECGLSFYWEGSGTGGGPVITPQLSELLYKHQINLDIGFYYERQSITS
jgi:hypothetical protein